MDKIRIGFKARWFLRRFAAGLRHEYRDAPRYRRLRAAVQARAGARAHMPGQDAQASFNFVVAAALESAAELLQEAGLSRGEAVAVTRAAMMRTGAGLTRVMFAVWLVFTRDPVRSFQRHKGQLCARSAALWGEGMMVHEQHTPDSVTLQVTTCPFAQYFAATEQRDLTSILCEYDRAWMAQVNLSKRPVRALRRHTIAAGAKSCDFRFERI